MNPRSLVIGTRGSELALWQARHVQALLAARFPGEEFRLEIIRTQGDRIQDRALFRVEDKGFFTKELEDALRERRIDAAVHSLKDLPTETPAGLSVAAVPAREDAHDVWISRDGSGLREAPPGARVGTSSLRRQAQIRALRPDLVFEDLRGNVPTRLRRLEEGRCDALVLARAGLARLGLLPAAARELPFEEVLPAPGQGALGIEIRADDPAVLDRVRALEDPTARRTVTAERAFLARLQGGCLVPVGAHATVEGEGLRLVGMVADLSGDPLIRGEASGPLRASDPPEAAALGILLAEDLLARGAGPILDRVRAFLRAQAGRGTRPPAGGSADAAGNGTPA